MKKFILALFIYVKLIGNDDCKIIDDTQQEFISYVTKKYNIKCGGDSASFPKKLESLGALFEVDRLITIDESRLLLVNLVNDFQKIINKNEKIKPLLATTPFTADRIDVTLLLRDGKKLSPPDVFSHIFTARGDIFFCTHDLQISIFDQKEIMEPLEEACEKTGISIPLIRSSYSDYGKETNTPPQTKSKS